MGLSQSSVQVTEAGFLWQGTCVECSQNGSFFKTISRHLTDPKSSSKWLEVMKLHTCAIGEK